MTPRNAAGNLLFQTGREAILVDALAAIASNLGMGSCIPSEGDSASRPLRVHATEMLEKAGYVYKEYPSAPDDGWYLNIYQAKGEEQ